MAKTRYRVLEGHHVALVKTGRKVRSPDQGMIDEAVETVYGPGMPAGDVFETEQDMLALNGQHPKMRKKFDLADDPRLNSEEALMERIKGDQQRLQEIRAAKTPSESAVAEAAKAGFNTTKTDRLQGLSLKQLQEVAAEEEIDLKGAKTADDARKVLTAALTATAGAK